MKTTRTGNFAIGFRRGWSDWQKNLPALLAWARQAGLGVIDLGNDADTTAKQVSDAGLKVGSADLKDWGALLSPDAGKRKDAVAKNAEYVKAAAAAGAKSYFICLLPEKPELKRSENFAFAVESFNQLAPALEKAGAAVVIEGYPGNGALVCTPEGYREFFKQAPSKSMAINYDPSHLIRMGIDPIRFLNEFGPRVRHVHGKDTEVFAENLYEFGHEQPATFANPRGFGGWAWRYAIPGHGNMRWTEAFKILKSHNYQGAVSIELEDDQFNGSEEGEKTGLVLGAQFLEGC